MWERNSDKWMLPNNFQIGHLTLKSLALKVKHLELSLWSEAQTATKNVDKGPHSQNRGLQQFLEK